MSIKVIVLLGILHLTSQLAFAQSTALGKNQEPATPLKKIRIAVASNFTETLKKIVKQYQKTTDIEIRISSGSTGLLYTQIVNGAPFDLFFSADSRRPQLLIKKNKALNKSLSTYAIGVLVLWSHVPQLVDSKGNVLFQKQKRTLALANAKLAPYGCATRELLQNQKIWPLPNNFKVVTGESLTQTYLFVKSKHADLGFVALSQVLIQPYGSWWIVPQQLYAPLKQQVVLLNASSASKDFLQYVLSSPAQNIIRKSGYKI